MRSRGHMIGILAASLLVSSALVPLPEVQQQRSDPPPRARGPGEQFSRRQRKKARIAERKKLKAGIL
jgi:hypothetical protein